MHRVQRLVGHLRPAHAAANLGHDPALVTFAPEVLQALQRGDAVVALESTIISHGMPFPQNLETALAVEATAREGTLCACCFRASGVRACVNTFHYLSDASHIVVELAHIVTRARTHVCSQ
jgi:hypothetical protein